MVEVDGFFSLLNELFVEDVEHLEERGVGGNVVDVISHKLALSLWTRLPPNFQFKTNLHLEEDSCK